MSGRLDGKVAMVTGAGSSGPGWGNGKATAVLFAREGARVAAIDVNREAAEETAALAREEGVDALAIEADVTDDDAVRRAVGETVDRFGSLDVLHNNVGILSYGGVVELDPQEWDRTIAVNQRSMFITCKHAIPVMRAAGCGAIVNVSSVAGVRWVGVPAVAYQTSKGAVIAFTRAVALQHAREGIRANSILPGFLDTPMVRGPIEARYGEDAASVIQARHDACPMGRMGDAWDIAHAALFLASDEAKYVTGTELVVDGGVCASAAAGSTL